MRFWLVCLGEEVDSSGSVSKKSSWSSTLCSSTNQSSSRNPSVAQADIAGLTLPLSVKRAASFDASSASHTKNPIERRPTHMTVKQLSVSIAEEEGPAGATSALSEDASGSSAPSSDQPPPPMIVVAAPSDKPVIKPRISHPRISDIDDWGALFDQMIRDSTPRASLAIPCDPVPRRHSDELHLMRTHAASAFKRCTSDNPPHTVSTPPSDAASSFKRRETLL